MLGAAGSCGSVVETVVIKCGEEVDGGVYGCGFFFETHEDCFTGIGLEEGEEGCEDFGV